MHNTLPALAAIILALWSGNIVSADVFSSPTRTSNAIVNITHLGANRYNVTIKQVSPGTCVVLLDSTDSNDIINKITIQDNTSFAPDQVILTIRKDQSAVARSSLLGVEEIDILNPVGVKLDLRHVVIDGSIGSSFTMKNIETSTAREFNIGGNLYANIIANNITSGSTSTDDITMNIEGSVIGAGVYNNSGDIASVVIEGNVQPSTGDTSEFWSSSSIGTINIGGSFEGRIGSNDRGFSGHPDVSTVAVDGSFTGSSAMTMNSLETFEVGGDFDADITVSSVTGSSGFYSIGGEMASTASISLPAEGLEGQVIVNSAHDGDSWDGDVVVGSTTLAPNYTTLSSELGDGQVGIAPFNFHQRTSAPPAGEDRDCNPYHTEAVMVPYDAGAGKNEVIPEVRIRHYGPVFADGSGPHFDIEFKSAVLPSVWEDRSGLFEIDTNATATSALTAHRDVVIKKTALNMNGFTAAGQWRIRPKEGKLRCGDVAGNPDADYSSWYIFGVFLESPSGGLLLENGTTSFEMTEWGIAPYEVNADGETDSQDFADLADSYSSQ